MASRLNQVVLTYSTWTHVFCGCCLSDVTRSSVTYWCFRVLPYFQSSCDFPIVPSPLLVDNSNLLINNKGWYFDNYTNTLPSWVPPAITLFFQLFSLLQVMFSFRFHLITTSAPTVRQWWGIIIINFPGGDHWGRLNNSTVAKPQGLMRSIQKYWRLWVLRGCLGWHVSINIAWKSGAVQKEWQSGVVVPLFKNRVCVNSRGITLLTPPPTE